MGTVAFAACDFGERRGSEYVRLHVPISYASFLRVSFHYLVVVVRSLDTVRGAPQKLLGRSAAFRRPSGELWPRLS